ncbi:unnamed protein product [Symbiodinium natans]|uniref:Uncharacterized protein n=1 Tax=Symbiodinium natans TaxID=878477 RepID=A0A812PYC9_9DINO|nr:unnamed protein product [Symbiodinium natans]
MEAIFEFLDILEFNLVRSLWPIYVLWEVVSPDAIFLRADLAELLGIKALDEFHAYARSWADIHSFPRPLQLRECSGFRFNVT